MGELDGDMACQELVELVTEYLEGCLAAAERTRFEEHLAFERHRRLVPEDDCFGDHPELV